MEKPKFKYQGKVVIEPGEGSDILMMLPNGDVEFAKNPAAALKKANAWCKDNMDENAINAAVIEWRGGLKPPVEKKS